MAVLSLRAGCDQLAAVREFVAETGAELELDGCLVHDLQLAIDEACTNVIEHAYGGQGGEIELSIEPADGGLRIVLRDWGTPFDPEAVPVPDVTAPLDQRRLGGLGLYLMRSIMDEVRFEFEDKGNTLIMFKRWAPSE